MPPAIYIHLGQQKTGTTSVQRFCLRYRGELQRQLSLYYPLSPTAPHHRHPRLFPFDKKQWETIRREMAASGCTRLLISNEGWYVRGVSDSDLAAIRELFPGAEIFFVLYLRRLDDYCKARYNQRIKNGTITQPGYASYRKLLDPRSTGLRPSILLSRCERQVGADHVLTRIYDPSLLKNGNIVDDMFATMSMDLPDVLERDRHYNLSIPHSALPYMTDALVRAPEGDPLKRELLRKLSFAFSKQDEGGMNEALQSGLEKEIELLDARYLPGYKKLFEKRKCDLSFPELEASPQDVLIVDLLYSVLFELRRQRQQSFVRRLRSFMRETVPGMAARLVSFVRKRLPVLRKTG